MKAQILFVMTCLSWSLSSPAALTCYALMNLDKGVPTYTTYSGLLELPSVLSLVAESARKNQKQIRLVFAQSNFGKPYDDTPHNAGVKFLKSLWLGLKAQGLQSGVAPKEAETVHVAFDDGSVRLETVLFETEKGKFRTSAGEVRVLETEKTIVVFSQMIGDYNNTGPFVVSLMKKLGITGSDLLIVRDDLKSAGVQLRFGELKAGGNNGIRGILTSQTEFVIERVKRELPLWLQSKGYAVDLNLNEAFAGQLRDLYLKEDLRYSHGEDYINRSSTFFKTLFQALPERERKVALKEWTEVFRKIVKENLVGHELLLGTADDMQSFLQASADHQQIGFVLTPIPNLSVLSQSSSTQARDQLMRFVQGLK